MTIGPRLTLLFALGAPAVGLLGCAENPDCSSSGGEFTRIAVSGAVGARVVDVAIFDVSGEEGLFTFDSDDDEGEIDREAAGNGAALVVAVSDERVIVLDLRARRNDIPRAPVGAGMGLSITGDIAGATETGTFDFDADDGDVIRFDGVFAGEASTLEIRDEGGSEEGGCV